MIELVRVAASNPSSEVVAAIEEDGVVVVEGMLDHEQLARLNAELDSLLERASPDHDKPSSIPHWPSSSVSAPVMSLAFRKIPGIRYGDPHPSGAARRLRRIPAAWLHQIPTQPGPRDRLRPRRSGSGTTRR